MTQEITLIEKEITDVVKQVSALNITDATTMATASETRAWIKDKIKFLKNHKEVLYRPFKSKIDAINDIYRPIEKLLDDADKATSAEMSRYQTELVRKQREAEAKIAARVEKGTLKIETAMKKIEEVKRPVELEDTGFVNKPLVWVTNDSLIPRHFLTPDFKAIEAALKEGKAVPGCELRDNFIPRSK